MKQQGEVSPLVLPVSLLGLMAVVIWNVAPHMTSFFLLPEKRLYLILLLCLLWLMKYLMVDFDAPRARHRLEKNLLQRFEGALHFLRSTTSPTNLDKLPWYLLIGPPNAGKTSLLANSGINFILQKQCKNALKVETSENCDWWVTHNACIVDIPGKYLSVHDGMHPPAQTRRVYGSLWHFFLRLLNNKRRHKGINGLILVLPVAQLFKLNDTKYFSKWSHDLMNRIREIQHVFSGTLPCQLVLTKCDLLPGFKEFFAESSKEELAQPFGITLPSTTDSKIMEVCNARFNSLIKKINQQLLWRIHQERNPLLRPQIKDFPLQLERIKEFTLGFIKNLSKAKLNIILQGIHLTSALQPQAESKKIVIDPDTHATHSIAIFKELASPSQAFFVKQLLSHGLTTSTVKSISARPRNRKHKFAYAIAASAVLVCAGLLGLDFQQGLEDTYAMKQNIEDYEVKIATSNDATERLFNTISLLNLFQPATDTNTSRFNISYLLSFYTHQYQQKNHEAYIRTLRTVFMTEIRNYLEDYLNIPVNKTMDEVYAVLKAYLMMGDATYFNPAYLSKTFLDIMPTSIAKKEITDLSSHLNTALQLSFINVSLNDKVIRDTRKYLLAQPPLKLSFLILKNIDQNNIKTTLKFNENTTSPVLLTKHFANQIPAMFTAKCFSSIMSQESILAAQETTLGNWVLGRDTVNGLNPILIATLVDQLRVTYVKNYIETWESLLANTWLVRPDNLAQLDTQLMQLISDHSPLLQWLQTVYANTYFEPVISASPKLQKLGSFMMQKDTLTEILASLQSLHHYLQGIVNAENQRKAAFEAVSSRMLSRGTPDAITQLRIVAEKAPDPVKGWLTKIANDSWQYLMKESGRYLDTTWQTRVYQYYQKAIADRYPFNAASAHDLGMQDFIHFFGNPGIVTSFYRGFLEAFIDTSTKDWHWKKVDAKTLPFSEEALRQIREAMRIHDAFFPQNDNKPFIKFALRPYKFGKTIQSVKLNIGGKQFSDDNNDSERNTHEIIWPSTEKSDEITFIQLTLDNQQQIMRKYAGLWGWIKLINQSFESMISKKTLLINLSLNEHSVKYILASDGKYNPLLSFNLRRFHLPEQLFDEQA